MMSREEKLPESERVYLSFLGSILLAHLPIPVQGFLMLAGTGLTPYRLILTLSLVASFSVAPATIVWYLYRTGKKGPSVGSKLGIPIALIAIVSPFAGLTYLGRDTSGYAFTLFVFSFGSIVLSWVIMLNHRYYSQEERQEGGSGDSDGNRDKRESEETSGVEQETDVSQDTRETRDSNI